jgi:hypothetical protein
MVWKEGRKEVKCSGETKEEEEEDIIGQDN